MFADPDPMAPAIAWSMDVFEGEAGEALKTLGIACVMLGMVFLPGCLFRPHRKATKITLAKSK